MQKGYMKDLFSLLPFRSFIYFFWPWPGSQKDNSHLMIHHYLSTPYGSSVNDWISKDNFSVSYPSVDNAVAMVLSHKTDAYMIKIDLKAAFCQISVHPYLLLAGLLLPYLPVIMPWAYRKETLFSGRILGHGHYFGPRRIHGH